MKSKKISLPKKFGIPLTEKCHLRCSFCFNSDDLFTKGKHLDLVNFKKIVDWLVREGVTVVDLTPVVGEPLLVPNLSAYLDYLDGIQEIKEYEIFSSLAAKGVEVFFGRNKLKLTVSLYGLNEDQYYKTTKTRSFGIVKSNMRQLLLNKLSKTINILQRCDDVVEPDNELRIYLKIGHVFSLKKNYSKNRSNEFAKDIGDVLPCKFMHEPIVNSSGISLCCMDYDNKRKVGIIGDSLEDLYNNIIDIVESKKLNCNNSCGWFEYLEENNGK